MRKGERGGSVHCGRLDWRVLVLATRRLVGLLPQLAVEAAVGAAGIPLAVTQVGE